MPTHILGKYVSCPKLSAVVWCQNISHSIKPILCLSFPQQTSGNQVTNKIITVINSSPHGQNGRHYSDIIFKCIFMNEKCLFFGSNFMEVCSKGSKCQQPALVQVMDWCWMGNRPLPESMLMHKNVVLGRDELTFNTLRPEQNGCNFCKQQCQMHFLEIRYNTSIQISLKDVPRVQVNIVSGNGLALNRWQAII